MNTTQNYFSKVLILLVISIIAFFAFKTWLPQRLFSDSPLSNDNILVDSLMLGAMADSLKSNKDTLVVDSIQPIDPNFDPTISESGFINLNRFYSKLQALEQNKSKKVRIAYYGDSMNDGDYIVQDVRSQFQEKYGGEGVGFVAFTSISASARASVSHSYSKNWVTQSFIKSQKPTRPFGIDGQVFFAPTTGQSYWVSYKAQNQAHSTSLQKPVLFYGKSGNSRAAITIKVDKDSIIRNNLRPTNLINTLEMCGADIKNMTVSFAYADSIPLYGFNFDDGKGVHVDNFSIRGNSGLPLTALNPSLMNAFDKELEYDLVVLHYGANVLNYGSTNYSWYEKNMTGVINNMRECFPNADILVISTADKASKIGGVMQTNPAVVPLAKSQKNFARDTRSGYVNLYNLMGGQGSMVEWVNNGSAAKDYTHFSVGGSKKIAKLISDEIETGYAKYKLNLTNTGNIGTQE